jgi:HlyD family secretion protein
LILFSYLFFFKPTEKEVVVHADTVAKESLTKKVTATGTIKPLKTVEVGTQVSGTVSKLFVDFNDRVKAGQLIATMDTRTLVAAVKESSAGLQQSKVRLNFTMRELKRTQDLFKKNVLAKIELDKAADDHALALAEFNSAQLILDRNKLNLDLAKITSPISGVIISRKVDEGQTVAAAFAAPVFFVIANDLKKMKIEASVDEADVGEIAKGQKVEFTVDAFPEKLFTGVVEELQLEPINLQNVVTYIVEIIIDNKDLTLIPGMTANLEIIVAEKADVLTIPNSVFSFTMTEALAEQLKDENYNLKYALDSPLKKVWTKNEFTFTELALETGETNGIKTEIKGNIEQGSEIINSIEIVRKGAAKAGSFLMPKRQEEEKEKE